MNESSIAARVVHAGIHGYVYVVQMEGCSWLKIGRTERSDSEAVSRRVKSMQTGCPRPLQIVKEYPCEYPAILELGLHKLLAKHRQYGEWFDTTIEQIERVIIRTPYNPTVWREALEQERAEKRAQAAAEQLQGREIFEAWQAQEDVARKQRVQESRDFWAHEDATRADKVRAEVKGFALARKKRRRGKIVRGLGLFLCGVLLGVLVTLMGTMQSIDEGPPTDCQGVQDVQDTE